MGICTSEPLGKVRTGSRRVKGFWGGSLGADEFRVLLSNPAFGFAKGPGAEIVYTLCIQGIPFFFLAICLLFGLHGPKASVPRHPRL